MSRPGRPLGDKSPQLAPRGVRPSPELQARVQKLLESRGIDRLAVVLGTSAAMLAKVEMGAHCKPDALERLARILDEHERKTG